MGSEVNSFPNDFESTNDGDGARSLGELFDKLCPYYMAYGMSYDEYWNGDPALLRVYREYHEIKRSIKNQELWLQGLYVYEAILDASPLLHPFPKQGTKPKEYPKEPYPITLREKEEKERREQMANMIRIKTMVSSWLKGDETDGR